MCDSLLQRGGAAVLLIGGSCCRGQVSFRRLKPPRLLCDRCQTNARFCLQLCRCHGGGKEAGWSRKQVSGLGRCGFCCCCVPGRMQHVVSTVTTGGLSKKPGHLKHEVILKSIVAFLKSACQGCQVWGHCRWVWGGLVLVWEVSAGTCQVCWWPFLFSFRLDCFDLSDVILFTVTFHFSWYSLGGGHALEPRFYLILMVHYSFMVCG